MTVEPIRDKNKIKTLQNYIKDNFDLKYYLLFLFGLNTGLRVGDILKLNVKDIMNPDNSFKEYLTLREKKTGKEKKIKINDSLKNHIKFYIKEKKLDHEAVLFKSRQGKKAITRVQAYRALIKAARAVGIENFGTHTMRKTWGYWTYLESDNNIGLVMDILNHSSPRITLRYIGINQDQKDKSYQLVQF